MELEDTNLYSTLGIDVTTVDVLSLSDRDITRAYRKAALRYHPDKNRSDPSAAEKFSAIFIAYETLSSPTQRAKYDAAIRAVRQRKLRFEQLDENRRRLKTNLDRREKAAAQAFTVGEWKGGKRDLNEETLRRMQREIERLRRDIMTDATSKAEEEKDGRKRREVEKKVDGGEWVAVDGFAQFRSGGASEADFAAFEHNVLTGNAFFS